jgi:hypothetical protein
VALILELGTAPSLAAASLAAANLDRASKEPALEMRGVLDPSG